MSLYEAALNANWPSPGEGEFDESVFDLVLSPSPPSIEHGVSPNADANADKFLMDTNHVLFPELIQVPLTKEDISAEQKKDQARSQVGNGAKKIEVLGDSNAANANPGQTEPLAAKRKCVEVDKGQNFVMVTHFLDGIDPQWIGHQLTGAEQHQMQLEDPLRNKNAKMQAPRLGNTVIMCQLPWVPSSTRTQRSH